MLRYALVAYILLLSLTGPNPCCCTLARFVELTMSWVSHGHSAEIPCSACCREQFAGTSTNVGDESQQLGWLPRSEGQSKRCQCDKSLCNAVPSQSSGLSGNQSCSSLDKLTLNLAGLLLLEVGEFSATEMYPGGSDPAHSGREIRILNHSWQC